MLRLMAARSAHGLPNGEMLLALARARGSLAGGTAELSELARLAARWADASTMEELMDLGLDIRQRCAGDEGEEAWQTPLHEAVRALNRGPHGALGAILARLDPSEVDVVDGRGITPLVVAARRMGRRRAMGGGFNYDEQCAHELMNAGADPLRAGAGAGVGAMERAWLEGGARMVELCARRAGMEAVEELWRKSGAELMDLPPALRELVRPLAERRGLQEAVAGVEERAQAHGEGARRL